MSSELTPWGTPAKQYLDDTLFSTILITIICACLIAWQLKVTHEATVHHKKQRLGFIMFLFAVANALDILVEALFYGKQKLMLNQPQGGYSQASRYWVAYETFNLIYFITYDLAVWLFTIPFMFTAQQLWQLKKHNESNESKL